MFFSFLDWARHHFKKVNVYNLLRYNLEQQCLIRSVKSSPRFVLVIYFADIFPFQSYRMAEALEEHVT